MKKFLLGFISASILSLGTIAYANTFNISIASFPIYINGEVLKTEKPILAIDGSTYLPLKSIGDALDVKVQWNDTEKRVDIGKTSETVQTTNNSTITIGQKNALKSAKSYLDFSAFSRTGLIKQLEFEKYTHEDVVYAVNNCGANWNDQAAKSAKSYLEFSSFSRDGLIKQLEFEGFTNEQAIYGVEQNGY